MQVKYNDSKRALIEGFDQMEVQEDFLSTNKNLVVQGNKSMIVSDGYHTFDELYEHRYALFIALCKKITEFGNIEAANKIWRSKLHSDGTMYDGYFIMGIESEPGKQISYHIPLSKWEITDFVLNTFDNAPKFDGHTANDVIDRLLEL